MFDIPPDLPLPTVCPECGEGWTGYETRSGGNEDPGISLFCALGHEHRQAMTEEEVLAFLLAAQPDELLGRPVWLVGDDQPMPEAVGMMVTPPFAEVGRTIRINRRNYVVVSVDVDRVWVRVTDD